MGTFSTLNIRVLLTAALLLAGGWIATHRMIAHLKRQEAEASQATTDLREQIDRGREEIRVISQLQEEANRAESELDRLRRDIPKESAIVWPPRLIEEHFKRFGIRLAANRLARTEDEEGIPGSARGYWAVGLRMSEASDAGSQLMLAVADLEQQCTFLKVMEFAIRPDPEKPDQPMATLNIAALVRK